MAKSKSKAARKPTPIPAFAEGANVAAGMFDQYWRTRMKSCEQRLDAALQLIDHNPTRGTLAEQVVREVVDAFLPGQWTSSSGFVLDAKTREPSKQVDVLVYDQLAGTPLYSDESIVVLSDTRPGIAVEVKSELDHKSLGEALGNIASFKRTYGDRSGINGSIYAFRGFAKAATLKEHLKGHIRRVTNPNLWPDVICVQGTKMVVTRGGGEEPSLQCKICEDPVIQSLLTNVLNALGVPGTEEFLPEPALGKMLFELK
jgi:hypothetical protein